MFSFRSFFQFNLRHKGRNKIANFFYIDMYLQFKKKKNEQENRHSPHI